MRGRLAVAATLLMGLACWAGGASLPDGANTLVRQIVQSLIDGGKHVPFAVADKVFALDNGETHSGEELKKAWPQLAKVAFKKKVSLGEFFDGVDMQVCHPRENKRLMSNKRVMKVYQPQDGDLYLDASREKKDGAGFIGYGKAFIYIVREVDGKWTLIATGG